MRKPRRLGIAVKRIILPLILLLAAMPLQATEDEIKAFDQVFAKVEALQADFTQDYHDKASGAVKTSSGRFYYQKPGRMRWVYEHPDPLELVLGDLAFWVYDPLLATASLFDPSEVRTLPGFTFFFQGGGLLKDYVYLGEGSPLLSGAKVHRLRPKTREARVTELHLQLNAEGLPQGLGLLDSQGNWQVIRFNKLEKNPSLTPERFEFKAPSQIEIIDKRKLNQIR